MRRLLLSLGVIAVLLPAGGPAAAGGWWSTPRVDLRPIGAGETVTVQSEAYFMSAQQAAQARREAFYAYLVRGYDRRLLQRAMGQVDPQRWWALRPGAEVVRVGRVRLGTFDMNVGEVRARITIPDNVRGEWSLMLCDDGCREPFASAVPTTVMIAADAVTAQTARRLNGFERREREVVARLHEQVDAARAEAHSTGAIADDLRSDIEGMRLDLATLRAEQPQPQTIPPWVWVGTGLLLGLALGALARRSGPADDGYADPGGSGWEHPQRLVGHGGKD